MQRKILSKEINKQIELTRRELEYGCRLRLYSRANNICTVNHVRILEHIEGPTCDSFAFNDSIVQPNVQWTKKWSHELSTIFNIPTHTPTPPPIIQKEL